MVFLPLWTLIGTDMKPKSAVAPVSGRSLNRDELCVILEPTWALLVTWAKTIPYDFLLLTTKVF